MIFSMWVGESKEANPRVSVIPKIVFVDKRGANLLSEASPCTF